MPIYEYQCPLCNEQKEVMHKHTESPEVCCPRCGEQMHKLISSCNAHFKGDGFYETDYKNKEKK